MKSKIVFCVSLLMLVQAVATAKVILVPSRTYQTIQAGITAAVNGDIVEVAPNPNPYYPVAYTGPLNRNLDFGGKVITVRSQIDPNNPKWDIINSTIIDCCGMPAGSAAANRAFWFHTSEGAGSQVIGFTIKNGYARGPKGADGDSFGVGKFILIPGDNWLGYPPGKPWQTSPPFETLLPGTDPCTLPPATFDGSSASGPGYGGAILCEGVSSPTIAYCVFEDCTATGAHGGKGENGISGPWSYYTWADFNWAPGPSNHKLLGQYEGEPDATLKQSNNGQWGGNGGNGSGTGYGGAIALKGSNSPTISNCHFINNSAQGGRGGDGGTGGNAADTAGNGTYTGGLESGGGDAGSSIGDGIGGAIYAASGCNPMITSCHFEGNIAKTGPRGAGGERGLGNVNVINGVRVPAGDSSLVFASGVPSIAGGAAYFANGAKPTFADCNFIDNKAYQAFVYEPLDGEDIAGYTAGGAMFFVGNNTNIVINTCDFIDNTGGALYFGQGCGFDINNAYAVANGQPGRKNLFQGNSDPHQKTDYAGPSFDTGMGGAIYISSGCYVEIGNANFSQNSAKINGGAIESQSDINISDCAFSGNVAEGSDDTFTGFGGAIDIYLGTALTINATNCSFTGNQSIYGGAISPGMFDGSFTNCFFIDNKAQLGGALDFEKSTGLVTITGSVFRGNRATMGSGGGIYCLYTGVDIQNCEFFNNSAEGSFKSGGGIDIDGAAGDGHTIKNCLFVDNSSSYYGGAINCASDVTPQILDCTFSQNTATELGGTILADSNTTATIKDCIIEKSNNAIQAVSGVSAVVQLQYCLFFDNTNTTVPGGSNNAVGNPLFVTGTLGDYYLSQIAAGQAADSPAVNTGSALASALGLDTRTTATNDIGDTGTVDRGYHYSKAADMPKFHLTTSVVGGIGTISVSPAPPDGNYYAGTIVTVTVQPQANCVVKNWTGTDDDYSTALQNTVTMSGDKDVTVELYIPRILYVGGSSGYPTIQAAIDDANDKDIIILMPSDQPYYTQAGFTIDGRNITITSINPNDPAVVASTVIQQQGDPGLPLTIGPAFTFSNVGPLMRLQGITIRGFSAGGAQALNGDPSQGYYDGLAGGTTTAMGIQCYPNASPTIKNCVIDDCHSRGDNGGNGAAGAAPLHPNGGNGGWPGGAWGGGLFCYYNSNPTLINCTFSSNSAIGGNGGDGGSGAAPPNIGSGGRGGGWYYGYPIPSPWEPQSYLSYLGELPKDFSGLGGAAYIGYGCAPTFENCTFTNNFSRGGLNGICGPFPIGGWIDEPSIRYKIDNLGGAVYLAEGSSADFNNCTFTANTADPNKDPNSFDGFLGFGGAIAAENYATPIIRNCRFSNNTSDVGGGVYSLLSYAEVNNCDFADNNATHGGGLLLTDSVAYITGSTFSGNVGVISGSDGGAIGLLGTNAEIADCDITNNRVGGSGGGIYISSKNVEGGEIEGENSVLVKNCLITGNVADLDGGGISATWHSDPNIVNCTIAGNIAQGMGGGLYSAYYNYTHIINSIFWDNTAPQGPQIAVGTTANPAYVKVTYSDIEGGVADVYLAPSTTLEWDVATNINIDPLFIGGFFLSQIAAGQPSNSPCVDAGSADVNSPDINLGGYSTRTDSANDVNIVDMGYHYSAFTPPQYHLTIIAGDGLTSAGVTPADGNYIWFCKVPLHVIVTPPDGYQVVWTGTDNDDINDGNNSVRMTGDKTVTVGFGKNTCNLTVIWNSGGTVTPTSGTYARGETVTLTATPDSGYRIESWEGTDNDGLFTRTNTVTMNRDKTVKVTFSLPQTRTVPGDFTTIQAAVEAARSGDIVIVASGNYRGNTITLNKEITMASTNPDDPCVVAATIIDSMGFASQAIVFGSGATGNTVLDGFTITGGTWFIVDAQNATVAGQNGPDGGGIAGGAVYINSGASPTIKNCVITDTTITGGNAGSGANADATVAATRGGWAGWSRGGGIYIADFANPTLINCTITNCTAVGGNAGNGGNSSGTVYGAADYRDANYGGSYSNPYPSYQIPPQPWWELRNSNGQRYVGDYRFYSGYGGGVFCDVNSEANFIDCNIINNTARGGLSGVGGTRPQGIVSADPITAYRIPSYGGGVYCGANSDINFVGCVISGNVTPRPDATYHTDPYLGHGGGIAFEESTKIRLRNCTISNNNSAVGGGVFWAGGAPEVLDCNLLNNVAYLGGGIYATESAGQIKGCTLRNNFAGVSTGDVDVIAGQGGGIFGSSIDTVIADCFLTDNTSSTSGGGIHIYGPGDADTIIRNCLLLNNQAGRDGGGISTNWGAVVSVDNCTLFNNQATGTFGVSGNTGFGGGLYCSYEAQTNIRNSIIWDNNGLLGNEIAEATGFEHEQRCGTVSVSYSDIKGGQAGVYISPGCPSNWGLGNIDIDPCFVNAAGDDFHLQQITAGQTVNSPCIDAGGDPAVSLGMFRYSTSTLGTSDTGIVDLGYHYPISEYCRKWDLFVDNLIDFRDFAVFASAWVDDLGYGIDDLKEFTYCWLEELEEDMTAPTPNPMTWAITPHALAGNSVEMTAHTAVDSSGQVYYQFEDVNGPASAWQTDPYYIATGLNPTGEYCFRVRARDKYNNITAWSEEACVTDIGDVNAPTPPPIFVPVAAQNINRDDPNNASGQFMWDPSSYQWDWWHRVIVDVTYVNDDITPTSELEIRFICSDSKFSSDNVIPAAFRPIRIGYPVAIGERVIKSGFVDSGYRLTWNGTNQIVYDVYVDAVGGSYGKQLDWHVCVYDASGNSVCTATYTIPQD